MGCVRIASEHLDDEQRQVGDRWSALSFLFEFVTATGRGSALYLVTGTLSDRMTPRIPVEKYASGHPLVSRQAPATRHALFADVQADCLLETYLRFFEPAHLLQGVPLIIPCIRIFGIDLQSTVVGSQCLIVQALAITEISMFNAVAFPL
jgi:hypothetical protein